MTRFAQQANLIQCTSLYRWAFVQLQHKQCASTTKAATGVQHCNLQHKIQHNVLCLATPTYAYDVSYISRLIQHGLEKWFNYLNWQALCQTASVHAAAASHVPLLPPPAHSAA
jgi:hypothetical protein